MLYNMCYIIVYNTHISIFRKKKFKGPQHKEMLFTYTEGIHACLCASNYLILLLLYDRRKMKIQNLFIKLAKIKLKLPCPQNNTYFL